METPEAGKRAMLHCNMDGFSLCRRHTLFPEKIR
jgi:hypothetical protein